MEKVLSIIIPTYNMEKYLRKCLDSLIVSDENMQRLEVLVINDGSKDSSSQIAHEYEAKYPQTFRVIDKENRNYGSCINRGLKEATGKYVKVLDADDYFDTISFEQFIILLASTDADLVISDYSKVNEHGDILDDISFSLPRFEPFKKEIIKENTLIEMHAITYSTRLLKDCGYKQTEGISYTDTEWRSIPLLYVKTVLYCPCQLYKYLIGREGQTMNPAKMVRDVSQMITVVETVLTKLSQSNNNLVLYGQLTPTITSVYHTFLVKDLCRHTSLLREFDKRIKDFDEEYYSSFDSVVLSKYLDYHYIREWRKNKLNVIILSLYWKLFSLKKRF